MIIKEGEFYENKTYKYLLPCVRGFGDLFIQKFNSFFKLAVGISDVFWESSTNKKGRYIFVLCDTSKQNTKLQEFIVWLLDKPYYIDSYYTGNSLLTSNRCMVVLELPKRFDNAYNMFVVGEYSKMFTLEEINTLFPPKDGSDTLDVITNNMKALPNFISKLNKEFNSSVNVEDFKGKQLELDLPLNSKEEIFNTKNGHFITFKNNNNKIAGVL